MINDVPHKHKRVSRLLADGFIADRMLLELNWGQVPLNEDDKAELRRILGLISANTLQEAWEILHG